MRVLVAPHRFGALLAPDISAEAIAAGWRQSRPNDDVVAHPHSDGSAGFLNVIAAFGHTEIVLVQHRNEAQPVKVVRRPLEDEPWHTVYCHTESFTDLHDTAGDIASASSAAMGDLIATVVGRGAKKIIIGAGITPWHDAGAGMLARLADVADHTPRAILIRSQGVVRPELAGLVTPVRQALQGVRIIIAGADEAPLLGLHGAGAQLAERPGIDLARAQEIESSTIDFIADVDAVARKAHAPNLLDTQPPRLSRRPYSGVGGGVGFMLAALGGQVYPGAWVTGEETDLDAAFEGVDAVVTGAEVIAGHELGGGVVSDVATRAGRHAIPVIVLGGRVDASRGQLFRAGIHASYPVIDPLHGRPQITAPPVSETALIERGARLAKTWSR